MRACIEGDADMLKQILVNLVKNAVEALAALAAGASRSPTAATPTASAAVPGAGRDRHRPGPVAEVLANLFSAVRSTKDGAHHGLGLSIVHSLVKKLNGQIACRSGRTGTAFEILLPAWPAQAPRPD
jgi:signal transduction histidine kinase